MLHLPLSGWLPGPNSQACKTLSACGTLQTSYVVRTLIIKMCLYRNESTCQGSAGSGGPRASGEVCGNLGTGQAPPPPSPSQMKIGTDTNLNTVRLQNCTGITILNYLFGRGHGLDARSVWNRPLFSNSKVESLSKGGGWRVVNRPTRWNIDHLYFPSQIQRNITILYYILIGHSHNSIFLHQ